MIEQRHTFCHFITTCENTEIRIIYLGRFGEEFSHCLLENQSELSLYSGCIVNLFCNSIREQYLTLWGAVSHMWDTKFLPVFCSWQKHFEAETIQTFSHRILISCKTYLLSRKIQISIYVISYKQLKLKNSYFFRLYSVLKSFLEQMQWKYVYRGF